MNAEKLSDALSFLDDDIIEETESFRSKQKNYKSIWLRCLSAAACICVALVAVLGIMPHHDLPLRGGGTTVKAQSDTHLAGVTEESLPVDEFKYGGWAGGVSYTSTNMTPAEKTAYLEITEWKANSFYALVLEGYNDGFDNGTKVKVKLNKRVWFGSLNYCKGAEGNIFKQGLPSEEDFPVGSKVYVVFSKARNSFLNSKAEKVINAASIKMVTSSHTLRGPGSMMTTYYVDITKWNKSGFEGIIKGSKNNRGEMPVGEEVTVKFEENLLVKKTGEKGECYIPTEADFPVGSRVEVLINDVNVPEFLGKSEIWIYSIGNISANQTVLVTINQWTDNGFKGDLAGENGQLAFYYTNQPVAVEFDDNTRTESREKWGTTTITLAPTEEDFPVGTTVEVSYKEFVRESANERVYIAERIWLYE